METKIIRGHDVNIKLERLTEVEVDNLAWKVYYKDVETGEKWVKEYPFSEGHAGGPTQLRLLSRFPWELY